MKKTFVGFGFGPIQSALFVYEAYRLNNFSRFVVADVDQELVNSIRANQGTYTINIAREACIDKAEIKGIEIYNPKIPEDLQRIINAAAESDEMCTALPSVNFYTAGNEASIVNMIKSGLSQRRRVIPTVIYTAENNNHAAEILSEKISDSISAEACKNLQFLNTVIGKMSGVITDMDTINRLGLTTITPDTDRAILVEEFNRILVSQVTLPEYTRGIEVFIEKKDLLPFEEAKLYGHNAIHALIAYLADVKGYNVIAEAGKDARIMEIARKAFINESGRALIKRHSNLQDPLFTSEGYEEYADDLLKRMVNPNLNDSVERVGRDHIRKLGIEDRLYGTIILALEYGIEPHYLTLGAAAGIKSMIARRETEAASDLTQADLKRVLKSLWGECEKVNQYGDRLISLTWEALRRLNGI